LVSSDKETDDRTTKCPGLEGYSLLILESDDRVSITIQDRNGGTSPLNFWDIVSPTFSTLGEKVEWRMTGRGRHAKPQALIVRVRTVDQSDVAKPTPKELLVAVRITDDHSCVTGIVPASQPSANLNARRLADNTKAPCIAPIKTRN
jgi:hypothetical protein